MFGQFKPFLKEVNEKFSAKGRLAYGWDYFFIIVITLSLFSWLQASPTLPEPDSFYHAKLAQFISQGEVIHKLPWLQETALKNIFSDHHFLYHLLLAPFTFFNNPLIGIKFATVLFATLLTTAIYWLFKKFQIKWPFIFIIFLLTIQPWLFRVSLVKAPAVFLILFILAFYSLAHQKKILLFIVSFLSTWLYAGWPLILGLGILYLLISFGVTKLRESQSFYLKLKNFLLRSENQNKFRAPINGLIIIVSGLVAGLVINPYFPGNLTFFWQQFVDIAVINYQSVIEVGGEWYPYGFIQLIADAPLAAALLLASLLIFVASFKKQSIYSWLWGILSLVFFLLTLKSRRYVELYVPFTVIFSAFCLSDLIRSYKFKEVWQEIGKVWQIVFGVLFSLMVVGFIINIPQDLAITKRDMEHGQPITKYQNISKWLKENIPQGAIVFNTDWDDFPALFYYNDQNYYLTGLDPTFMYAKDKLKYDQYVDITLGRQTLDLGYIINNIFNSNYIFLDNNHKKLEKILKSRIDFKLVYEDNEGKIFQYLPL